MNHLARIVFMGSPNFALPTLNALHEHYSVVGVVTQPDRPGGRGGDLRPPAVKGAALRLSIPVIQPERIKTLEVMEQLHTWAPDLVVVAAYGLILHPDVLNLPRHGCINIHASLLPRWRGAAPIQAAILAGDRETGITIMKMDAGMDTGPILAQRPIPIANDDTCGSLFEKMAQHGAELLLDTLPRYISGELIPKSQPEKGTTYAPLLKKEDGRLDFTRPATELERRVRAMNPWPGAYFEWQGQPFKVHKAHTDFVLTYMFQQPGTRTIYNDSPAVYGGDNTMLVLDEVQLAGKKPMPGRLFLDGARNWVE